MAALTASMLLPSKLKSPSIAEEKSCLFPSTCFRSPPKRNQSSSPVMRLFGPAIFEASKLKVLVLGVDEEKQATAKLPRTYTLTHSDITSKLTLAISRTINNSQVLNAFVHGDENLFNNCPELQEAMVWVYFHSSIPKFNTVECWGPLRYALDPTSKDYKRKMMMINQQEKLDQEQQQGDEGDDEEDTSVKSNSKWDVLEPCTKPCNCCYPPTSVITWTPSQSQTEQQEQLLPGDVSTNGSR